MKLLKPLSMVASVALPLGMFLSRPAQAQNPPAGGATATPPAGGVPGAVATPTPVTPATNAKPADEVEGVGPTPAAEPAGPGTQSKDDMPDSKPEEQAANDVTSTQPPLSAVRGGSLGFPSSGYPGVVAALKLQAGSAENTRFDVLAQVGALRLGEYAALDIVAEQVAIDVPIAAFTPGPSGTPDAGWPLPKLRETSLTSVGFRFRLEFKRRGSVEQQNAKQREQSACFTKAAFKDKSAEAAKHCSAYDLDLTKGYTESEKIAYYVKQRALDNTGFTLSLGGRFLYRSEEITGAAPGVAAEFSPQYDFERGGVFVSGSILWLNHSREKTDDVVTNVSKVLEWRTNAGAYLRFNLADDPEVAQRIGVYGSYARNYWKNEFASDGTAEKIRGYQTEGGIFFGGHFSGGFNGQIQFSARRPYGHDPGTQFIVSVVPSLGKALGGGS